MLTTIHLLGLVTRDCQLKYAGCLCQLFGSDGLRGMRSYRCGIATNMLENCRHRMGEMTPTCDVDDVA